MTATSNDIKQWLDTAESNGTRWLIIAVDHWDYENYPMFCKTEDEFWDCFKRASNSGNMQSIDEIYDMALDREMQVAELRANHPPGKKV